MKWRHWCVLAVWAVGVVGLGAQEASLLGAARDFLGSLDDAGKAMTALPFNSEERLNWHFVPKKRLGISFREMNDAQREKAHALLRAGLSESGYKTVEDIRSLEDVLHTIEGAAIRDSEDYHMLVFGEPGDNGAWSVRYEGHHISLSWTVVDGKVLSSSPQFLGANPAEVRIEGPKKGFRALAGAEDLGRAFLKSLDADQAKKALLPGDAPADILTRNEKQVAMLPDEGIAYGALTPAQQGMLMSVIEELAKVQPPALSKMRLDKIREAGIDAVRFAWMGGVAPGEKHYYRVQGPTFLIEYDNTQNDANHVHTVWRDFKGDFGADVLKEHYAFYAGPAKSGVHQH